MKLHLKLSLAAVSIFTLGFGQSNLGSITGNIESTFQYLNKDSLIGANQPESKALLNSYANIFYTVGNFKAGIRLESYMPRIQGYPDRYDGTGLGMRYFGYSNGFVDVTLGNFYEQFGSGLLFRSYEDRALGYDNNMDGMRLIVRPYKGVVLKGVYGSQRLSFQEGKVVKADGIVRGADAEVHLNESLKWMSEKKLDVVLGASFVSKFQKDDNSELILPQNVGSYGGRLALRYGKFTLNAEYARKENDPSEDNNFSYNPGQAALINLGYSQKGLGIILSAKSADNMSLRSDRSKTLQDVLINYLPALNKTHTYNLVATLYPYATQAMGEVAYQAEVLYTFKKDSKLGGKYGMPVNVNFSTAYGPIRHTSGVNPLDSNGITYTGRLFDQSSLQYWQDINVNITRKFNKNFSLIFSYFNIRLNNDISKVAEDASGIINSHIGVIEMNYKINKKHALRAELQGLFTKKDKGDWATAVLEYTISPNWFFSVMDQYNYGNSVPDQRLHYLIGSFGYVRESSRFMLSYGRQRAGLFCVGGVCRFVPASNGLTFTFTQSF
ncbi:MAG: DUF6029 family protein [Crocinitomicaceae bacterium]|nr:DUF6029 family protein [Crocinitomicaceae bacterium]